MDKIKILKAKILKGDKVEISYLRTESDLSFTEINENHKSAPHKDLTNAFANLAVHAALLSEFIAVTEIDDIKHPQHPKLKDFNVSGFTISGDEEEEGVIITGLKTLRNGKVMMFNTPLTRFEDSSDNRYDFMDELHTATNLARKEVKRYLEGHRAPDPQQSLPFGDEEKPKKRGGRKTTIKVLPPEHEVDPSFAKPDAMLRVAGNDVEGAEDKPKKPARKKADKK